jgi:hypothetical protein
MSPNLSSVKNMDTQMHKLTVPVVVIGMNIRIVFVIETLVNTL